MQSITFGVFAVIAVAILIIEKRIAKKPAAQRSNAENKFMTADRSAAQGMNFSFSTVSPIIAAVAGLGLLVFGVVWLSTGQERAGWVGLVLGSVFLCAGILLFRMRTQRSHHDSRPSAGRAATSAPDEDERRSWDHQPGPYSPRSAW